MANWENTEEIWNLDNLSKVKDIDDQLRQLSIAIRTRMDGLMDFGTSEEVPITTIKDSAVSFLYGAFIGQLSQNASAENIPTSWLEMSGQTVLRANYPDLWDLANASLTAGESFFGIGDGSTTFDLPSFAKDYEYEFDGTGDETLDLTTGYIVGDTVFVKNRKTSDLVNIDIDLTDNIPLGKDHSLRLRLESDGWHCDLGAEIDKLVNSDGVRIMYASGVGELVGWGFATGNGASIQFLNALSVDYNITNLQCDAIGIINGSDPTTIYGSSAVGGERGVGRAITATTCEVGVRAFDSSTPLPNGFRFLFNYVIKLNWTTQSMKG